MIWTLAKELLGFWRDERGAKHAVKLARFHAEAKLAEKKLDADISYENTVAGQMSGTWKDEYLVLLLTWPLWLGPFPEMAPVIERWFEVIRQAPEWYFVSLGIIIMSTFGVRRAGGVMQYFTKNRSNENVETR